MCSSSSLLIDVLFLPLAICRITVLSSLLAKRKSARGEESFSVAGSALALRALKGLRHCEPSLCRACPTLNDSSLSVLLQPPNFGLDSLPPRPPAIEGKSATLSSRPPELDSPQHRSNDITTIQLVEGNRMIRHQRPTPKPKRLRPRAPVNLRQASDDLVRKEPRIGSVTASGNDVGSEGVAGLVGCVDVGERARGVEGATVEKGESREGGGREGLDRECWEGK